MKRFLFAMLIVFLTVPVVQAKVLEWQGLQEATGYVIFYSDASNNWSKDVGNVTEYELDGDLNLDVGVEYDISVAPYNSVGIGESSSPLKYTRTVYTVQDNPKTTVVVPPASTVTIVIQVTNP